MSSRCCFLLRLLSLVQKSAHARGAVREPRGLATGGDRVLFDSGGAPFFETISGTLFVHQQTPKMVSKWSKTLSKNTLLHNMRDLDFCFYLQHFVAIEPPKTIQKVLQNRIKKSTAFRASKSHPISSQKVPT